ncbi:MAG: hypothetical protein LBP20_10385 [Treponema sp.]|jgi:hypothetical protein|nr:hypothetical protein [Treponema sp.]
MTAAAVPVIAGSGQIAGLGQIAGAERTAAMRLRIAVKKMNCFRFLSAASPPRAVFPGNGGVWRTAAWKSAAKYRIAGEMGGNPARISIPRTQNQGKGTPNPVCIREPYRAAKVMLVPVRAGALRRKLE